MSKEELREERYTTPEAALNFARGILLAVNDVGGRINAEISKDLKAEIAARLSRGKSSEGIERAWSVYDKKLFRFRPRFIGALASYSMLSRLSLKDLKENEGLYLFRVMWVLGAAQDDLIDELHANEVLDKPNPRKEIIKTILGPHEQFYQAALTILARRLMSSNIPSSEQLYLKKKIADWYGFLARQEVQVMESSPADYTFEYCVKYREEQNGLAGEVLVALLNGARCLDEQYQRLETLIPQLSFRTQIIDDIADIAEDILLGRPSYAIGALTDNPEEMLAIKDRIQREGLAKITPKQFEETAPQSYAQVLSKYDDYGERLAMEPAARKILRGIGDIGFIWFPRLRDIVHKINPEWSNF